jgi:hypothetical protein
VELRERSCLRCTLSRTGKTKNTIIAGDAIARFLEDELALLLTQT